MMKDKYLVDRLSEYTINVMFKHAVPYIKAKFDLYQKQEGKLLEQANSKSFFKKMEEDTLLRG